MPSPDPSRTPKPRPKRYPHGDPAARQEQLLARWLEGLDLSTLSTIPHLSRMEAEYIAERLVQDNWVTRE